MFGLFQADLPIKKQLWRVLLVVVLVSAGSTTPFKFSNEPSIALVDVLLFYGHISVIFIGPGLVVQLLAWLATSIERRYAARDSYRELTGPLDHWWEGTAYEAGFVISAFLATPSFGTETMRSFGMLGIGLILLAEILRDGVLEVSDPQMLELLQLGNVIVARALDERGDICKFTLNHDWLSELDRLAKDDWIAMNVGEGYALLKRERRVMRRIPTALKGRGRNEPQPASTARLAVARER